MKKTLVVLVVAAAVALPFGGTNAAGRQKATPPPKYCNIGADPVDVHRKLASDEEFRFLARDAVVTMGTGSGKDVRCVLKQGEKVAVSKASHSLPWVAACGNPLREHLPADAFLPVHEPTKAAPPPKPDLIILGIYESAEFVRAKATRGGVITDTAGKPVTDSRNAPVTDSTAR